jgi:NAD(P)-dependent dehydrogenase (short-subunit alcohol dehydrogenase family)
MFDETNEIPVKLGICLFCLLLAGKYENHFWRIVIVAINNALLKNVVGSGGIVGTILQVLTIFVVLKMPMFANFSYMKRQGVVMVTGCDSGMGKETVIFLAKSNDNKKDGSFEQIFAACFDAKASRQAFEKILTPDQMKHVTVVPLDVTKDTSVSQAASVVKSWIDNHKSSKGLCGIVMYHGIAFNGPAAYMPIDMYERQLQVNFLGNLRVVQNCLPILKERKLGQGRIIFTGTGGGSCSPAPPLLTAYMSSKFAIEGYCHALRAELSMTRTNINCSVINPGFVKPTMLMEEGQKLTEKMWKICEGKLGSTVAKDEFGILMDHFTKYSALQPGTHVSEVSKAAEHALLAKVPRSSYKVGIDSKLAPIGKFYIYVA